MQNIDYPPKPDDEVEAFEDTRKLESFEKNASDMQRVLAEQERIIEEKGQLSPEDKEKILQLEETLKSNRIAEITSTQLRKPTGGEEQTAFSTPLTLPKESPNWRKNLGTYARRFIAALGFVSAATATTEAQTKTSAEDIFKNTPGIEKQDLKSARPVKELPTTYTKLPGTIDGKEYAFDVKKGETIPLGAPGAWAPETPEYVQKMKDLLAQGATVEDLVKSGRISPKRADEFKQFEKAPEKDIVYIETQQEENKDAPQFAKEGERYFGPNNHAVADIYYESRSSKNASDGGRLNTSESRVKIQMLDDVTGSKTLGQPVGNPIELSAEEARQYLNAMTTHITSEEALTELRKKAGLIQEEAPTAPSTLAQNK